MNSQKQTVQQLLHSSLKQIDKLDAELLISHVTHKSREFLIAHPEYKVGKLESWKVFKLIKKRAKGIPLAYLIGHKEFFELDFMVNKYTLVPRPDTETMVELVLERLMTYDLGHKTVLIDVGTGSGCIPISITKTVKTRFIASQNIDIVATDISKQALRIAKKNAKKHNVEINFLHGNLLEPIIKSSELRTLTHGASVFPENSELIITANLPYLTEEQFETEPSIQHEPKSTLVADKKGLALYEKLLQQFANLPICQFTCFLEIDPGQTTHIKKIIRHTLPDYSITISKDLAGLDRIVTIQK